MQAPGPIAQPDKRDRFVDDAQSPHYNSWQKAPINAPAPWKSAERVAAYRLAVVVKHNMNPIKPGAGSAIFIHLPHPNNRPTAGCTAIPRAQLLSILSWLDPGQRPVLIQGVRRAAFSGS